MIHLGDAVRPVHIGARSPRREDDALLTGAARFTADIALEGMLEVAFARSPFPHATIESVDLSGAAGADGVVTAIAASDLEGVSAFPDHLEHLRPVRQLPLAADRVRYVGAPIAAVAATDRYLAEDAVGLVEMDLVPIEPVMSVDAALAAGAVLLYDDWPDNKLVEVRPHNETVDEILGSSRVVSGSYRMQRHSANPMETRGCVARFEAGRLTVWTSTQNAHIERTTLAAVLGMPESSIRVVAPAVGGGFGTKLHIYPEDVVVAWLAIRLDRPVRWIEDRREHFLSSVHAREQRIDIEAAVDENGLITALRAAVVSDVGSGEILPPGTSPSFVTAASLTGPYRIPNAYASVTCVVTNKTPSGAYRGFGTPEMVFAVERLIEKVAIETGQDPVELRRRMLITPEELPYTTPSGRVYDSGTHLEAFDRAVEWGRAAKAGHQAERQGLVGVGYATYVEGVAPTYWTTSGKWPAHETTSIRIEPDGYAIVAGGTSPMGQGTETMIATVAADALGTHPDRIIVRLADTDTTPYGLGSFGSRSAIVATGAILEAARAIREKMITIAAHMLEAAPGDLVINDGSIHVRGSETSAVTIEEVAELAYFRTFDLPAGVDPGLEVTATYNPANVDHRPDDRGKMNVCVTYANSSHAAVVEIDPDTYQTTVLDYLAVHDAGPLINPAIVDGQIHGGLAQGIGGALLENIAYSEEGQPLVTTFLDYPMPSADGMPDFSVQHLESPAPSTPLGLKGVGEAGATGPAAAIANAVCDALERMIDITATPITPSRLRALIETARHSQQHTPGARK